MGNNWEVKSRARIAILYEMLNFATYTGYLKPEGDGFQHLLLDNKHDLRVGDLVVPCGGRYDWYLAWVIDINLKDKDYPIYGLECVETGEISNWTNVSFRRYNRERIKECPQWRWTDKQFALNDKWLKFTYNKESYLTLPNYLIFNDDNSVKASTRRRYGLPNKAEPMIFPNWKKVTNKMLKEYFLNCIKENNDD